MSGTVTIEYTELIKAIKAIEKKAGICKKLPSAQFDFKHERFVGSELQITNHGPEFGGPDFDSELKYSLLVCDTMNGKSTGTQANDCKNCTLKE